MSEKQIEKYLKNILSNASFYHGDETYLKFIKVMSKLSKEIKKKRGLK